MRRESENEPGNVRYEMRKGKGLRLTVFVLATVLMMSTIWGTSANFSVWTNVVNAYYTDSDADGYEDDVIAVADIMIYNGYYGMLIELYVGLELPSGAELWYFVKLRAYVSYFTLEFNFKDSATEQGWYTVHIVGFSVYDTYSVMNSYTFDPPGGTSNQPPSLEVSVIS